MLFAGLVNGKNIWKNHYEKTLQTIEDLPVAKNHIVLSTSCSLLHVPYTLQHEQKLSEEYKAYFAYAEEKLVELQELSTLAESADHTAESTFVKNKTLFLQHRDCENEEVTKRLAGVRRLIIQDFRSELSGKNYRRRYLVFRNFRRQRSDHSRRQRMSRQIVLRSAVVRSQSNSILLSISKRSQNALNGRKRSVWMFSCMANMSEMTW